MHSRPSDRQQRRPDYHVLRRQCCWWLTEHRCRRHCNDNSTVMMTRVLCWLVRQRNVIVIVGQILPMWLLRQLCRSLQQTLTVVHVATPHQDPMLHLHALNPLTTSMRSVCIDSWVWCDSAAVNIASITVEELFYHIESLDPVCLVIKEGRLRWFVNMELKMMLIGLNIIQW